MFEFWIIGGAIIAPVSLWWARKGWVELDRLSGRNGRATDCEVAFGYFAVTAMALIFLGFIVPATLVLHRLLEINPAIAAECKEIV